MCKKCRLTHFNPGNVLRVKRCEVCGRELISSFGSCTKCREQRILMHTDKVIPLFSYRLWNKELLFKWKIAGERSLSSMFAEMVAVVLKEIAVEVIVPVPPRKGKIQKNGWDQIDELCQFLSLRHGFRLLKILSRNSVNQQKKLNRKERLDSIKSAYSLCSEKEFSKVLKHFDGILPEKVCLIDDVCTTGATIESCAEILKKTGVKTVDVITLFTVD